MRNPVATRALFAATAFVAAALVFLVQPMVARQLLPAFGGTPAVWNTAVVFFQVTLLAGYALAHASLRVLGPRRQVALQLALAVATIAFLPFALRTDELPPEGWPPAAWIVALLAIGVGVPYLAVATTSPVLQRWYAAIGADDSHDPYFLYSASNAGSLVGLLAYPFVLEPALGVGAQERTWAWTYVAYLATIAACAIVVRRRAHDAPHEDPAAPADGEHIGPGRAIRWVLVAALPASLMLGVTTYVTTDVASAPLLWVVPLALYLVSFMVTFGRRVHVSPRPAGILAAASIVALVLVELDVAIVGELTRICLHLLALLASAVLAHALLYEDRPAASHLTTFYLLLSLGGAIGGAFTALLAPALFDGVYEYPLLLAAVLLLRPAGWREGERLRANAAWRAGSAIVELAIAALVLLLLGSAAAPDAPLHAEVTGGSWVLGIAAACVLLGVRRWGLALAIAGALVLLLASADDDAIFVDRNFYGTVRVRQDETSTRLLHGTTLHGAQLRAKDERREPTTYYSRRGPIGDVFDQLQQDEPFVEVGVVGLGSGALLAYERIWQRWTFYEIDPLVLRVARDERFFTWLSGAEVAVDIVEGDARLQLAERERDRYDLLVLDAYSSDAVPVHLLTAEAFELYLDRLASDGVIALHVSSRHLDLEPVVAAIAARAGMVGVAREDAIEEGADYVDEAAASHWIALARDEDDLEGLPDVDEWRPIEGRRDTDAWTDDRSDVASSIRWLPGWVTPG